MNREIMTRNQIIAFLCNDNSNYYVDVNDAVKSLFSARQIIRKYIKTNNIKDRLLINSVIITNNILGVKTTNRIIYNSFNDFEYKYIKSVLAFLDIYDSNYGANIEHDEPLLQLFNDTLKRHKSQ